MSTKVIHLHDEAHNKAKEYCKANGLRMSEWVASLIYKAMDNLNNPDPEPEVQNEPKKKPLVKLEESPQTNENGVPLYSMPPFWAKGQKPPEVVEAEAEAEVEVEVSGAVAGSGSVAGVGVEVEVEVENKSEDGQA